MQIQNLRENGNNGQHLEELNVNGGYFDLELTLFTFARVFIRGIDCHHIHLVCDKVMILFTKIKS